MLRDVPTPVSFFCCDRLHTCVFVCVSSRCGVSYRFLHLLSGQTVIGCILKKGQEGLDVSRRGSHPSCANQIGERRAQLRLAGMDTPCLEFPLNGRMPLVCQCVLQTSSPKCSDGQTAYSLGRVQTSMTPLHHLKVSCFCVRGDPARGTFLVSSSQIHQCERIDIDNSKLLP